MLSRPGTASQELGELRAERDKLMVENRNMKQQIQDLNAQIKQMLEQDQAAAAPGASGGSGDTK